MTLAKYLDELASTGRYHFTTGDAIAALGASPVAVRAAIRRRSEKGHLVSPSRGFHLIVPPEYRSLGCLPADQFVPQLMDHLGLEYYAGLLTAASLHGAAHQAPMVFQIVVRSSRAVIRCGRVEVDFTARANVSAVAAMHLNTPRGLLRVSTAEATAFDLVGYPHLCGGLSNVATILHELADCLKEGALLEEAAKSPLPWSQRLGYLLDVVGVPSLADALAERVSASAKEYVPLRSRWATDGSARNRRWRLLVNDEVDPDVDSARLHHRMAPGGSLDEPGAG